MSPETFQNLALAWIGAATIVVGALAGLIAVIMSKVSDLKERANRQGEAIKSNAASITTVALSVPPTLSDSPQPAKVEVINTSDKPVETHETK